MSFITSAPIRPDYDSGWLSNWGSYFNGIVRVVFYHGIDAIPEKSLLTIRKIGSADGIWDKNIYQLGEYIDGGLSRNLRHGELGAEIIIHGTNHIHTMHGAYVPINATNFDIRCQLWKTA